LSGAVYRGSVDRSPAQLQYLASHGDSIQILGLHGVLFFGTATSVLDAIRRRLDDPSRSPLRFIILDCRLVTGADISIATVSTKLQTIAHHHSLAILIAGLGGPARDAFRRGGAIDTPGAAFAEFPDLDRAVERCEHQILSESAAGLVEHHPLVDQLTDYLGRRDLAEALIPHMERLALPSETRLLEQGAPSDDLYLVESGELKILLLTRESIELRLRTITAGAIIGEIGFYLGTPRTASVVTTTPVVLYRFTRESLEQLRRNDPILAVAFTEIMVRLLARRLVEANQTVAALSR
jgi:SulP family sulfate permease